jgi:hypothetical protein
VVVGTRIAGIEEIPTSYRAAIVAAQLESVAKEPALIDLRDWSRLTLLLMTEIPRPRLGNVIAQELRALLDVGSNHRLRTVRYSPGLASTIES